MSKREEARARARLLRERIREAGGAAKFWKREAEAEFKSLRRMHGQHRRLETRFKTYQAFDRLRVWHFRDLDGQAWTDPSAWETICEAAA